MVSNGKLVYFISMKSAYIEAFGSIDDLKMGDLPHPELADHEVEIAVHYAGVNPVDWKIAEGYLASRLPHQFPLILGWDVSGVIRKVGSKVIHLQPHDAVYAYCRKPVMQWGSWTEFLTYPAEHVALKPKNLSFAQAAGIPLAGLTAWQALFEKAQLKPREKVLIHAGGGGVGSFAIQWAKLHDAQVITTVSHSKFDYVSHLGADEIIDYQKVDFVQQIGKVHPLGVDVVLDIVGGAVYKKSFEVLKPHGRIISILEQPDTHLAKKYNVHADYLFVSPNHTQLKEIATLFESGKAIYPQLTEFPLAEAKKALKAIKSGHTTGKIVLQVRK